MPLLPWGKRSEKIKRVEELLLECCERLDLEKKKLGKSGREWVARRRWNGDHGEMRRSVYYAALSAPGTSVEARHFVPVGIADHEAHSDARFGDMALEDMVGQKVEHFFERLGRVEGRGVYKAVIKQVERPLIKQCMDWAEGNQLKAARVLGINRNTLRKKVRELGINDK